ncbi:MAG: nucleoside triphosphate pyrophosphohydrolase [Clostridia bacterium]|nr:nucleoside triphosphate pyrophosphohydrolase [Clostridia bacterium]
MNRVYNKLVRDNIPSIIEQGKATCSTRVLDDQEYLDALRSKLQEEMAEYLDSGDIEELVDLEEVLRAIIDYKGISYQQFEHMRKSKASIRGAFHTRTYLLSVDD